RNRGSSPATVAGYERRGPLRSELRAILRFVPPRARCADEFSQRHLVRRCLSKHVQDSAWWIVMPALIQRPRPQLSRRRVKTEALANRHQRRARAENRSGVSVRAAL